MSLGWRSGWEEVAKQAVWVLESQGVKNKQTNKKNVCGERKTKSESDGETEKVSSSLLIIFIVTQQECSVLSKT